MWHTPKKKKTRKQTREKLFGSELNTGYIHRGRQTKALGLVFITHRRAFLKTPFGILVFFVFFFFALAFFFYYYSAGSFFFFFSLTDTF